MRGQQNVKILQFVNVATYFTAPAFDHVIILNIFITIIW
jgi:hypothetical protein